MKWWPRLTNVFRAGAVDRELDDEMQFHVDERIRELMQAGRSREEATREAARMFGNPLLLREQSRDVKLLPWLDSLTTDALIGARMLRKHAVATTATIASLSLALGACVAAFSLLDALVLRPLPVRQPEQLVYVAFPTYAVDRPESDTFNDPLYRRLRDAGRGHIDLFAMSTQVRRIVRFDGAAGEREQVRTQHVTGDAFEQLGIGPAIGRAIRTTDDRKGAEPVAVLSHGFWIARFGGDPSIVGRAFLLGDRQVQIVGVAAAGFTGIEPGRPTDVWVPYGIYDARAFGNPGFNWFRVIGRLHPGVEREPARSVLQSAFASFRTEYQSSLGPGSPEALKRFLEAPLYLRPAANGPSPLRRQFERPLWILAAIAALVLLVAGSNVANLSLARTAAREHEMALRISIGAGRGRLIQQVLIESALVASAACAAGLVFAAFAAPSVVSMLTSANDPVTLDLRMNWRVAAIAAGLTVGITALFGLTPALRASRVAPIIVLKTRRPGPGGRRGVMRPFVTVQAAFGVVVLMVGGLLVLSFARLSSVTPGFAASNVLLVNLETVERVDPQQRRMALVGVLDRLAAVPGVDAVSSAEFNLFGRAWTHEVRIPGTANDTIETTMTPVMPGFFETMMIPVVSGRPLARQDFDPAHPAMVVNESFARRYFGDQAAVGRIYDGRFFEEDKAVPYEIVGVVADTKYDLREPAAPTFYFPMPLRTTGTLHVRVDGDPMSLLPKIREEIRAAGPMFRVATVTTQAAAIERTLLRERMLALLSAFFAIVGLVLAAVGLYGVLSSSVVARTAEIGLRVALGARRPAVIWGVLADSAKAVLIGTGVGLAAGIYFATFAEGLLFEVTPFDFWSLALPLSTLLLAATVAAAVPAFRITRVDPVIALRYE